MLRLAAKRVRMIFEPEGELVVARRMRIEVVLDHELELLPEPPSNDGVVSIESHLHRFPDRDFFPEVIVDQSLQLLVGRWTEPDRREALGEMVDLPAGDLDAALASSAASPLEQQEESRAEKEEMDQRLADHRASSRTKACPSR